MGIHSNLPAGPQQGAAGESGCQVLRHYGQPFRKGIEAPGGNKDRAITGTEGVYPPGADARYAANFQKGLGANDILYYAKVHHERNRETGKEDMHAHIIVSQKDISNKLKLSPATNHRQTHKGAVRGGFDREAFVRACEQGFDRQTGYKRNQRQSFDYCHAMKNGSVAAIREQARIRVEQEFHSRQEQAHLRKVQRNNRRSGIGLSRAGAMELGGKGKTEL